MRYKTVKSTYRLDRTDLYFEGILVLLQSINNIRVCGFTDTSFIWMNVSDFDIPLEITLSDKSVEVYIRHIYFILSAHIKLSRNNARLHTVQV